MKALEKVVHDHGQLSISINNLREILTRQPEEDKFNHFDPKDPANKFTDGKLTDQGIEVCYRLFDKGANPNQVKTMMNISWAAANYRYNLWNSAGGINREKLLLV